MQTQSHFLMAAAALTPLRHRQLAVIAPAVLIGAVLPDIPFFLLTMGGEIYYRWFASAPPTPTIMEYLHFDLFYNDPLWIAGHNFFHSLVIDTLLLLAGLWWLAAARQSLGRRSLLVVRQYAGACGHRYFYTPQ